MPDDRLMPGDLVHVCTVFNEDLMDWEECEKLGLVLGINEHEPDGTLQHSPGNTFVSLLIEGTVYEHEYFESELQKVQ
jgi:hypothetical protein